VTDDDHDDGDREDVEPVEPIHGDDDEAQEAEEGEQSPAQAAAQEGSAAVAKKLDSENSRHIKAVSKILDMDMEDKLCPTCAGFGFADAPADDGPEIAPDETKSECPVCHGYGQLRTPSRNPDHVFAVCTQCSGQGWVTKTVDAPPAYAPVTQLPTPQTAQMGQLLPDGRFLPYGATEPIAIPTPYAG
jgi:hypothetical protein